LTALCHSLALSTVLPLKGGNHRLLCAGAGPIRLCCIDRMAFGRSRPLSHPAMVRITLPIGIQRRRADGARQCAAPFVRARALEGPRLAMTSDPRQARTRSSDVSEPDQGVSKGTALLALVLIAVFLYAVRWALLPFVVSAVGAYLCTPLIERFGKRTRLPRIVFVSAI